MLGKPGEKGIDAEANGAKARPGGGKRLTGAGAVETFGGDGGAVSSFTGEGRRR